MDVLYLKIMERLDANIPELQWIDLDQGQLETPGDNYPIPFPCCLIDFTNAIWQNVGQQLQVGDITLSLRVGFDIYEDTNNLSPAISRNAGLLKLQLLNKVHKFVQGFSGDHFNRLNRIGTVQEKREDGLKVYNLVYLTNMRDNNGMPTKGLVDGLGLKVNV